jgi:glycerophosphoryl diester phosphodiesterase
MGPQTVELYDPVIIAHRGLWGPSAPENSFDAVYDARCERIPWAECDVWPSADGAVVVIHDESLDRTTTGTGSVWQLRWEDLHGLRLRAVDGQVVEHTRLHSLHGIVGAAQVKDEEGGAPPIGLLVEVKPPDSPGFVRAVIDVLDGQCDRWMVQSFDEGNVIHALAADPKTPVALLVETAEFLDRAIAAGWTDIHAAHELLDEPVVDRMKKQGIRIGAWTVNKTHDLRRMFRLQVDRIITDKPLLARQLLAPALDPRHFHGPR